jgi:hypothetical protein
MPLADSLWMFLPTGPNNEAPAVASEWIGAEATPWQDIRPKARAWLVASSPPEYLD